MNAGRYLGIQNGELELVVDRVLILQSFRDSEAPVWVSRCLASVQAWAIERGYAYSYEGDELFERLPGWYATKVAGRKPIAADLARLLWIQEMLSTQGSLGDEAYDVVAWIDADVYVVAPQLFEVNPQTSCIFGYEYWLDDHHKAPGFRIHKNVHNAYCAFRPSCAVLPFLIEAVQRMVQRVEPAHLAPQFVGPKLLTSLHNIVGFELEHGVGAMSPQLATALTAEATGGEVVNNIQRRLETYRSKLPKPIAAVNLCASLADPLPVESPLSRNRHVEDMDDLLDVLATLKNGLI